MEREKKGRKRREEKGGERGERRREENGGRDPRTSELEFEISHDR